MKQLISKEENIGNIGTLRITKNLQEIIDRLHYKIGAVEWSGILFYKVTKGDIKNLKNLEFTADFLYPMNIGSHTYTEFDYNGEITNAYDLYEAGLESSTGLVHSHNNFNTFFSGTDQQELKDNASNYNYYISLIVNFAHEYCAKIAFPSKTTVTSEYWIKDDNGKLFKTKSIKEEVTILIGDLNIIIEGNSITSDWLDNRIEGLKTKKKEVVELAVSPLNEMYANKAYNDRTKDFNSYLKATQREFDWGTIPSKARTQTQEFLSTIIYQDIECKHRDIEEGLKKISYLKGNRLDVFEQILDINIEVWYDEIFGYDVNENLTNRHFLETLLDLSEYELKYGETESYKIIISQLEIYAY